MGSSCMYLKQLAKKPPTFKCKKTWRLTGFIYFVGIIIVL